MTGSLCRRAVARPDGAPKRQRVRVPPTSGRVRDVRTTGPGCRSHLAALPVGPDRVRGTMVAMTTDTTGTAARDGESRRSGPADSPFVRACRRRARPAHPGLVHASGRPVPAGVPGDPGQRGDARVLPPAGPGRRDHPAAGPPARRRRGDPVQRHRRPGRRGRRRPGHRGRYRAGGRRAGAHRRGRGADPPDRPRPTSPTWTKRSGCSSPNWATPR